MKENKKLETTNTEIVAQTPLTQITDNRREITELTDAEIKEIEKELEQYDKDSWQYSKYLEKFKHIGGEIPKNVHRDSFIFSWMAAADRSQPL